MIKYDFKKKMTLSVPKIKPLLSKTPEKMQDIIQGDTDEITNDDMEKWRSKIPKSRRLYGRLIIARYLTSNGNYAIFQNIKINK